MKSFYKVLGMALIFGLCPFIHTADGDIDTSFNAGGTQPGRQVIQINPNFEFPAEVYIQSDAKSVTSGTSNGDNGFVFAALRLTNAGIPDTLYGPDDNGIVIPAFEDNGVSNAVLIQSDNKGLLTGLNFNGNFRLARLTDSGSPDSTFGVDGLVSDAGLPIQSSLFVNREASRIDAQGRIYKVGQATLDDESVQYGVVRFLNDGSVDTTFGNNGLVTIDSDPVRSYAFGCALQPDGKIIVTGRGAEIVYTARLNQDGSLDESFGTNGIVTTTLQGNSSGSDILLQTDGKIIIVGDSDVPDVGSHMFLFRYLANGSLDNSFGTNGIVLEPVLPDLFGRATSGILQSDGKIVISADSDGGPDYVVRYTTNGSRDNTFGTNGAAPITFEEDSDPGIQCVAIQQDGKLVICSGINDDEDFQAWGLARLENDAPLADTTITCPEGCSDNPRPELSGTAQALSIVDVYVDDELSFSVWTEQDGSWSGIAPDVGQGSHTARAVARYQAGRVNIESEECSFAVGTVIADDKQATTESPEPVMVTLTATGGDNTYTFMIVDQPENGTVNIAGNQATYTPDDGFSGIDTFTYKATDGNGCESEPATVTITVEITNIPELQDLKFDICQNAILKGSVASGLVPDTGTPPYTFSVVGKVKNGSIIMQTNGSFIFAPTIGSKGPGSFTYQVTDANDFTATATVTITYTQQTDSELLNEYELLYRDICANIGN